MTRLFNLRRIVAILVLLAILPAPGAADERDFKRGLSRLKETILLAAPAYQKERHEPAVKNFFAELVGALSDTALEPAEILRVADAYATAVDTLKIRRRRGCDEQLRALLAGVPIPEPKIDGLFKDVDACLANIKHRRECSTTPEGLLKHYGDGSHVDRVTELFQRERSGGYATKAESGEIKEMLAKYYPDRVMGRRDTAEESLSRTTETRLPDPKLVNDLFK